MIRELTLEEGLKYNLAEMTSNFDKESKFAKTNNRYAFKMYTGLMEAGLMHIIVYEDDNDQVIKGAIGFMLGPDFHCEQLIAQETFWFVLPECRGGIGSQLIEAFEKKAKSLGCSKTIMFHLADLYADTLGKFFIRNGYELGQLQYVKEI